MREDIMKTHLKVGELYLEFRTCDVCNVCVDLAKAIDPIPQPYPDTETGHYRKYVDTPSYTQNTHDIRPVDEFQPRRQCKVLFESGKIDVKNVDEIQKFCKNFLGSKEVVVAYLMHLENLALKKKLWKQKRNRAPAKENDGTAQDPDIEEYENDSNVADAVVDVSDIESENDVVLNVVEGSDSDTDSDYDDVMFVPPTRDKTWSDSRILEKKVWNL